jgi:bifunctional lysine-specific demethylase and histidyl-hydroxylase MINA
VSANIRVLLRGHEMSGGLRPMSCQFLDNLSLASLVAPTSVEEFRSLYWERQPLIIHRKDPDYYADLFTLADFDSAIARSADYVKTANAATEKNGRFKTGMTQGREAILTQMREGGTLILDQIHNWDPNLGLLCRTLAAEVGHKFQTNLYLTPANGKGFSPHWDNHDVFILQVVGSKDWKIEKARRIYPAKTDTMGQEGRELRGDVHSFRLEQGDLIYIPRGFVHAAECGAEPSLHITLGVSGMFWEDLMGIAVRAAILQDEQLRACLPLAFNDGPPEVLVSRMKGMFRQMADEGFLRGVVEQYLDEIVTVHALDISGQITDHFQPRPLALADTVGPRRGAVLRTHAADDTVRLNYGARTITFPAFFREALEFALHQPEFVIRELPGELQDEEKLVFIERLIEEGLVVRKKSGQAGHEFAISPAGRSRRVLNGAPDEARPSHPA